MIQLYLKEVIHSKTYVWNGESVVEWVPIITVSEIYDKIKAQYVSQGQGTRRGEYARSTPAVRSTALSATSRSTFQPKFQRNVPMERTAVSSQTMNQRPVSAFGSNQESDPRPSQFLTEKCTNQSMQRAAHIEQFIPNQRGPAHADLDLLMVNIKNGITLRNHRQTAEQQLRNNQLPKRIQDPFEKQLAAEMTRDVKQVQRIRNHNQNGQRPMAMPTQNNRPQQPRQRQRPQSFNAMSAPSRRMIFSNEMAQKLSGIRKRFGEVKVTSTSKKHSAPSAPRTRTESREISVDGVSRGMTERIDALKWKLDQLMEQESWILTRLENVFKTVNK